MSFDVSLSSYFHGHLSGGVRRAMLQGLLPVSEESAKDNTWTLSYGWQRCTVELEPSAYDENTIAGMRLSGDCTDAALWGAILRIMQRENFVCLTEVGGRVIACEATRKHLPSEMQNAVMVRDAEALLRAARGNFSEAMEAAS